MTTARKTKPTKNPRAPKAKLELVGNPRRERGPDEDLKYGPDHPKNNPSRRKRRRKHRRKKNMSTGGKIAIAAAVVLVGIPLVLVTAGALGFRALVKKAENDLGTDLQPVSGSSKGYTWTIQTQEPPFPAFRWTIYRNGGFVNSGDAMTYQTARNGIEVAITQAGAPA